VGECFHQLLDEFFYETAGFPVGQYIFHLEEGNAVPVAPSTAVQLLKRTTIQLQDRSRVFCFSKETLGSSIRADVTWTHSPHLNSLGPTLIKDQRSSETSTKICCQRVVSYDKTCTSRPEPEETEISNKRLSRCSYLLCRGIVLY